MARLTREQLKIFGSTGADSYFGVFGSKAAGSSVNSKVIATIQSLGAWDTGLQDACVTSTDGSKAPFLEDINAYNYVTGYQQAYMFQEGIPEWAATVTYYKGSVIKRITGTYIELYTSLTDANLNNALPAVGVSDANWAFQMKMDSGDISIAASKKLYLDGGSTTYLHEVSDGNLGINGCNVGIDSGKKLFLDGDACTGNTYIYEQAADTLYVVVGGQTVIQQTATITALNKDVSIEPTKKLYFDGGDNTYFVESSNGTIDMVSNGVTRFRQSTNTGVVAGDFYISEAAKLYLDGAGDTYLCEASANTVVLTIGGVATLTMYNTYTTIAGYVTSSFLTYGFYRIDAGYSGPSAFSWDILYTNGTGGRAINFNYRVNATATTRFIFGTDGTAYADVAWTTFSPSAKKDLGKTIITPVEYLNWALEDAKKPTKGYSGIPRLKDKDNEVLEGNNVFDTEEEVAMEVTKYGKDICKISIGVALWAEDAEKRIAALESK
jgi:hypothetical protein